MTLADVRAIYLVHAMVQREFGFMPELVRAVVGGDVDRARVVIGHVELVAGLARRHHRVEDRHFWPKLLDRLPAEAAPLVRAMESEHQDIDVLVGCLGKALDSWRAAAAPSARDATAAVLDALILPLADHLAREEEHVVPLIARCVTSAECDEMLADHVEDTELAPLIFGLLRYDADPDVFRMTVERLPLRSAILERSEQAFAEHAQRVYGTATPPHAPGPPSPADGPCSLTGIA
ncbi:hemerythrin domain-containing protein [Kutzneria sp. CA-103260]|uniref:hemerythrin domain-containing protein n=1 Tax=Kutzneria sp. CA-103260 TaxID=2802641 RepID=UPI001BACCE4B|nr:hemerythrin domain-containing protein [Kutzneria sp. CA-103260]QUQ67008.1 Hemerythrin HHE cation binding domain protein [Kutzneria sp. CA-103260]